jgi:glycosyltransferase involved in cell wall biosynthesis
MPTAPPEKQNSSQLDPVAERTPRVSVVLATNRIDPYLPAAFASILAQTYRDFEFLIVLESTLRQRRGELAELCRNDLRVRFLEGPPLGGLGLLLNLGIGEARGEYIARMDGDDISLPHRIEAQVRFLDDHPRVAVVGGRVELIDEHDQLLPKVFPFYETDREIRRVLPLRNPMPHPALMMRRSVLLSLGGYKYGNCSEDYELWLRMSRDSSIQFANLDSLLLRYRRHGAQVTNKAYFGQRFSDMAGFLLTEALRQRSLRYLLGMAALHPWSRTARGLLQPKDKR